MVKTQTITTPTRTDLSTVVIQSCHGINSIHIPISWRYGIASSRLSSFRISLWSRWHTSLKTALTLKVLLTAVSTIRPLTYLSICSGSSLSSSIVTEWTFSWRLWHHMKQYAPTLKAHSWSLTWSLWLGAWHAFSQTSIVWVKPLSSSEYYTWRKHCIRPSSACKLSPTQARSVSLKSKTSSGYSSSSSSWATCALACGSTSASGTMTSRLGSVNHGYSSTTLTWWTIMIHQGLRTTGPRTFSHSIGHSPLWQLSVTVTTRVAIPANTLSRSFSNSLASVTMLCSSQSCLASLMPKPILMTCSMLECLRWTSGWNE